MNKLTAYLLIFILFIVSSCISNKDVIYLQGEKKVDALEQVKLNPYRLQISDVLSIKIKALDSKLVEMFNISNTQGGTSVEDLYFEGYPINDHGYIRIPVLGDLQVVGLTIEELRVKIEKQLLLEYFHKEADIFVVVKLGGFRYTINGEIKSPGTKTLLQEKLTILEAIANSGDILITGDKKEVMLIRQHPQGTEIHTLDLTSIDLLKSPYYYIQPNDYIYIKPIKQKNWGLGTNALQSFTTIVSALSLVLTTFLLVKNIK
ncbi:sugar transporter [Flavobacterium columnare]|uniref:Polysaccharide exporter n=2 Tax=Flavobacterium columnare TaxID=996 RepID=G8X5W2_FLACA|nr:polysaccharide biosynthesis/export family protein [Flavobacterium columnare]AEW85565.1 polysaccharide exporter [Flavobacterium columnare ATCC 49512]AMO21145.1 sugar transporter [Flavobacterium columnare]ANO48384.1 polysaccharide exporter [Flavobacterium columnare]AUX19166.1 sugar transporter [Flavobacterium columnare]MBF6652500.1 sugar transporter [Flavobacterium columnare]